MSKLLGSTLSHPGALCPSLWFALWILLLVVGGQRSAIADAGIAQADSTAQALKLKGSPTQGGLIIGKIEPGSRIRVDDRDIRVSPDGVFLVGFHRDHGPTAKLSATLPGGQSLTHVFDVDTRAYNIQRIEGVPKDKVTPPDKELERIRRESAMIAEARRRDDPRTDFVEGFVWPVVGTITGVYGSQRVYNGEPRRPHYGIDIAAPEGTSVFAPAGGVVSLAHDDMFYSGATLIIDHGHGLSSAFLHMSEITVKEGQTVKKGDEIGKVGSTGRSTGPHLDWRINLFKQRLDAALVAPPMPDQ